MAAILSTLLGISIPLILGVLVPLIAMVAKYLQIGVLIISSTIYAAMAPVKLHNYGNELKSLLRVPLCCKSTAGWADW